MSELKRAAQFRIEFIKEHPELEQQVEELFQLMMDEIDEGNSASNEVDLFISACDDLLISDEQ